MAAEPAEGRGECLVQGWGLAGAGHGVRDTGVCSQGSSKGQPRGPEDLSPQGRGWGQSGGEGGGDEGEGREATGREGRRASPGSRGLPVSGDQASVSLRSWPHTDVPSLVRSIPGIPKILLVVLIKNCTFSLTLFAS